MDERGWVVDFGDLDSLRARLTRSFDHTILVAGDDPMLQGFKAMSPLGQVILFPDGVGCEKFAQNAWHMADMSIDELGYKPRVRVVSAEVCEHAGNSASYYGPKP